MLTCNFWMRIRGCVFTYEQKHETCRIYEDVKKTNMFVTLVKRACFESGIWILFFEPGFEMWRCCREEQPGPLCNELCGDYRCRRLRAHAQISRQIVSPRGSLEHRRETTESKARRRRPTPSESGLSALLERAPPHLVWQPRWWLCLLFVLIETTMSLPLYTHWVPFAGDWRKHV